MQVTTELTQLSTIVDIRNWLIAVNPLPLEQFAIDWIEKYVDKANTILESDEIMNTDEEFRGAIHYETQTVLAVLRRDVLCYSFFVDLESLTRSRT